MKFNNLIPELNVSDVKKSVVFYTKILSFRIEYERPEDKFVFLSFQGSQIMICQQANDKWNTGRLEFPFGRGINFQIEVDDIEPIVESLRKNKHPLFMEPKDNWYRQGRFLLGNREFLVQDPDGYLLRFAQDLGKKPIKSQH